MPDLLSHALIGFALGTALSIRYGWLDRRWVTVPMLGALVPDADKISILIGDAAVSKALGLPFTWEVLHYPAGSLLVCALGALLCPREYRRRVFVLLVFGAATHLALDQLAVFTTGYSYPLLWPLSGYHFPGGDLYQSSDRWPVALSAIVAALAFAMKQRMDPHGDMTRDDPERPDA